jgi:type VI secretion system Hcp family effector
MWFCDEQNLVGEDKLPWGESSDAWFKQVKAFEVYHYEFGATRDASGESPTKNDAEFGTLSITKDVEKATVRFFRACTEETEFPTAILVSRTAGGDPFMYLQYVLRGVKVTSVNWSHDAGTHGTDRPDEVVQLQFTGMGAQYTQQKADGTIGGFKRWAWKKTSPKAPAGDQDAYKYFIKPDEMTSAASWKSRVGMR